MHYPHSHIWVNGRNVPVKDVINSVHAPRTEAESNSFEFIRDWFSGKQEFVLQTSGSTGTPKEIAIKRGQMVASALLTARTVGLVPDYNALVAIDTKYI